MLTGPVVAASVTFLLVVPPTLFLQSRRNALPRRQWYLGVGSWSGVFGLTLVGLTRGMLVVPDGGIATALDGLALVAGVGSLAFLGYYRRTRRRAGVT